MTVNCINMKQRCIIDERVATFTVVRPTRVCAACLCLAAAAAQTAETGGIKLIPPVLVSPAYFSTFKNV